MFFEWSLLTIVSLTAIFLFIKMYYYKNLNEKERKNNEMMKLTLQEAEVLIRKYQIQLQRSLGNIDILTEELNKLRGELKLLKQRNAQHRNESESLKSRLKDMESRIDALL